MKKLELESPRMKNAAVRITAAGVVLTLLGIVAVYFTTFTGVTILRVGFSSAPYDPRPHRVSGLLFLPREPAAAPTPAVVFSHGMTVSKEIYVAQCREMARQGLVVLAIDLRGHGSTGGANDFANSEMKDIWAAADFLAGTGVADPERIGAAGHSLGGISSTRAGIFQEGDRIKAVAAIYCWPGARQAIELVYGPIPDFIGKAWPFFSWSRSLDIEDAGDTAARDIVSNLTSDRPPNFLVVIGSQDELGTVAQEEQVIEKAAGVSGVEYGRVYGDFSKGTARELVVTGDTHLTEASSQQVLSAVTRWFFKAFGLPEPASVHNVSMLRYTGHTFVLLGTFLIGASLWPFALAYRRKPEEKSDIAPYRPGGRRSGVTLGAAAALLFAGASYVALPLARLTGLRAFVPFTGADILSALELSRLLLLLPATALLVGLTRWRKWTPLPLEAPDRSGLAALGRSAVLGAAPVGLFVLLYAPVARGMLLTRGVPTSAIGFTTLLVVLTLSLWAQQEYFHHFFMPAFVPPTSTGKRVSYVLSEAAVRGVALGLAFLPLVSSPLLPMGRPGSFGRFPVVPALAIMGFVAVLPVSALSLYARRRGLSVLAPCIAVALLISLFFGCLFSVRAW